MCYLLIVSLPLSTLLWTTGAGSLQTTFPIRLCQWKALVGDQKAGGGEISASGTNSIAGPAVAGRFWGQEGMTVDSLVAHLCRLSSPDGSGASLAVPAPAWWF